MAAAACRAHQAFAVRGMVPEQNPHPRARASFSQNSACSSGVPACAKFSTCGGRKNPSHVAFASEYAAIDTYTDEIEEFEEVPVHTVRVHDRQTGEVYEFEVPQDQYILQTAEELGIKGLPFSCRHGCCTKCAVRVKSGDIAQPRALGISPELKDKGYALMCAGFPLSDLELETQDEDEVYWLQFGRYFARGPIERDDYALELAMQDE